jgi:hypothetical protein
MKVVAYQSPNRLGLISLSGTIVAPRPTGRGDRDAECHPVKNGGEPCAGISHARFDVGGGRKQARASDASETGSSDRVRFGRRAALDQASKNPREEHHAVFQGRI